MIRKNAFSEKDAEIEKLIAKYEAMKANNKLIYFDSDQLTTIADYYAVDRQFNAAQEVISYGLQLHPDSSELLIEQAYLFIDTKQFEKAEQVLQSISEPDSHPVKLLKAELLINEEKVKEADRLLKSLDDYVGEDLSLLLEVAYLYLELGYPERAIKWLEKGLDAFTEEEGFVAAIADCYSSVGESAKAAFFYNKALDRNPYSPVYWTGLAKCYFTEKQYDKALEATDFAIAANDTYGEAYVIRAHSFFHLDNHEQAIEGYKKALTYKGLPPEFVYMFIGLANSENNDWDAATKYFSKSIEYIKINDKDNLPLLIDVYNNQALCYAKLGKFREAYECCYESLKMDPKNYESLLIQGRIFLDEDGIENYDQAVYALDKALLYSSEPHAWAEIGDCYFSYGIYPKARLCFEHVLEQDSSYEDEINPKMAFLCLSMNDHDGFEKYNSVAKQKIDLDELLQNAITATRMDEESICEIRQFVEEHYERMAKKKKGNQ